MEFFSSSFLEAEDKFDSGIQTLPSNLIAMSPDDNVPLFLFGLYNMVESRLNEIPGPKLYFVKDICKMRSLSRPRSIVSDTFFWISIVITVLNFFFIMLFF